MNDFKIPVEVDPTEDTEWNDILRSKGIIPERPPSPTEELEAALEEAVKRQHENRLESKDMDDLDELEDEEDEEFLNFYKNKRMEEIKKLSEKQKFGSVFPIAKNEYEQEVTLASADCFVVLHMSLQSSLQSRLLSSLLTSLAFKFPEIKFCDIPATRCIENYPESNCPTLIIYHNKDVIKQYVTLTQLGGNDTKIGDLERVLVDINAADINDKRLLINQEDEDIEEEKRLRFMKKSVRSGGAAGDDDDDFYD
mmetsp:Transcript_7885/g.7817  ORF Transcript_7885/g.7817 Transcript_7885/m.7817 type:complete len:253 (+) Transcript_7885:688-1446(+)